MSEIERADLYISLENGASFEAKRNGNYIELVSSESTGVAEWRAVMSLGERDVRKLRDWLNANVKD